MSFTEMSYINMCLKVPVKKRVEKMLVKKACQHGISTECVNKDSKSAHQTGATGAKARKNCKKTIAESTQTHKICNVLV